jgi:hypothetical protein
MKNAFKKLMEYMHPRAKTSLPDESCAIIIAYLVSCITMPTKTCLLNRYPNVSIFSEKITYEIPSN